MTDYTKLVEALRICSGFVENSSCSECDYFLSVKCRRDMMHDAAAAIEELQQIADHYEQTANDYWKEACEYKAQLPKRGEWLATKYYTWECSVCGKNSTTGMGYVQTRKALYNYCPNCGAKMREVQDG